MATLDSFRGAIRTVKATTARTGIMGAHYPPPADLQDGDVVQLLDWRNGPDNHTTHWVVAKVTKQGETWVRSTDTWTIWGKHLRAGPAGLNADSLPQIPPKQVPVKAEAPKAEPKPEPVAESKTVAVAAVPGAPAKAGKRKK